MTGWSKAWLLCGLAVPIDAVAEPVQQMVVEGGRYVASMDLRAPPGWQVSPHPSGGGLLVVTQAPSGNYCGFKLSPIFYEPVRQNTLFSVFQQMWQTELTMPGRQVVQIGQSQQKVNGAGTSHVIGQATVRSNGTTENWLYFVAEGPGGRASGHYICADPHDNQATMWPAVAAIEALTLTLAPVASAPSARATPRQYPTSPWAPGGTASVSNNLLQTFSSGMASRQRGW